VSDAATQQPGGGFAVWIMLALVFGGMYFLMIRPQQRRRREAEAMQSRIGPGDEVVTIGGLYGIVRSVDDETVLLEIAPEIVTRYARPAISRVVTPAQALDTEAADDTEQIAKKIVDPD
jgi:preprotein translocase subunit YajC